MESNGAERRVLILNYDSPRQRLMGWFLRDSDIPCEETAALDEAQSLLTSRRYAVLIVNTTAETTHVAEVVSGLRCDAPRHVRIIVLHDGQHTHDDTPIPADLCLHDVGDPDELIEVVKAALADEVPDEEPHEAAEEVVES